MLPLIPKAVTLREEKGSFVLPSGITLAAHAALMPEANRFSKWLETATGETFPVVELPSTATTEGYAVTFRSAPAAMNLGSEGYRLDVTNDGVTILAESPAGAFYATQTLRQCLPVELETKTSGTTLRVPLVSIHDKPAFGWRGMHLDVSRHFMPVAFIKKFLDLLALHKLNTFHWHLTDDQGWRVEIKKYPKLTEVGAWRDETLIGHHSKTPHHFDGKRHGGFYTQDELRDIVAYAAERHITIVPEIDMPGHMQAAVTAYPELGNTGKAPGVRTCWGISTDILNANDATIEFMQDVLSEVLDIFPSEYIHIGGDEAHKDQWKESAVAQARIKELGLKDEDELQSWFIRQMDAFLTERGRRLVGWDEILEGGLASNATVMSWRSTEGALHSTRSGHDAIMCNNREVYFDHYQNTPDTQPLAIGGFKTTQDVYDFTPVPDELEKEYRHHILGGQGQLWTEYMPTPEQVEYMAFPRLCALAETLWSPKETRNWDSFTARLEEHAKRLDALQVNRYRGPLDPEQPEK